MKQYRKDIIIDSMCVKCKSLVKISIKASYYVKVIRNVEIECQKCNTINQIGIEI